MGKGDKKTKRGKIIAGSYGVTRPGKNSRLIKEKLAKSPETAEKVKPVEKKAEADTETAKPKKETAKKATTKKETAEEEKN